MSGGVLIAMYHTTSIPFVLRTVGKVINPCIDNSAQTKWTPADPVREVDLAGFLFSFFIIPSSVRPYMLTLAMASFYYRKTMAHKIQCVLGPIIFSDP